MLKELRQQVVALLIGYLVIAAMLPSVSAEVQIRNEIRSGDLLYNNEVILEPFQMTLFHTQDAACSDTEALAISSITPAGGTGFAIAQTSAETATAAETGYFNVALAPYLLPYDLVPGRVVGGNPSWVASAGPISVLGLPAGTTMVFPDMTLVKKRINQSSPGTGQTNQSGPTFNKTGNSSPPTGYEYIVDANNSRPYLPGNLMQVKTVKNKNGVNETVIDRVPRPYHQLYATPEQIGSKTILERMWRNVHLNFNMDRAYSGETCCPGVICPLRNPLELTPFLRQDLAVADALKMTRPGTHLKKVMWPVGA